MTQAQTIPADFLQASLSMQDLLAALQEDMAALSLSSTEAFQTLKRRLLQSWENLPVAISDYKRSVQHMPREIKQRHLFKGLSQNIEAFELDVRRFLTELKETSLADVYRQALESRTHQLAQQIAALEEHRLVQKFLKGEVILSSKKSLQWGRKICHAVLGLSFLYLFVYSGLSETVIWLITGPLLLWAFSLETARHLNPRINQWVCQRFKLVMREREKTRVSSAIFYMLAMSIVYFVFPSKVLVLTMLFIAIGDPVAGIVGVYWGRRKLAPHVSLEGFAACAVTCALLAGLCVGLLFDAGLSMSALLLFSLLSGVIGAMAESSFKKIDDNLVMPLLSAPALWVLMKAFELI